MSLRLPASLLLVIAGCAGTGRWAEAPTDEEHAFDEALPSDDTLDASLERHLASERFGPAHGRTLSAKSFDTVRLKSTEPAREPPLGERRKVDIRFQDADLGNALRLLAEAGRFNLVVGSTPPARVTMVLRAVTPYDALVTLAEAHGLTVERQAGVVRVNAR